MDSYDPLGKYISIIYRYTMMHANKLLKPFNISSGQLGFLMVIFDHNGLSQEELSEYLSIDKSTTAKAVKSLEENGYIIRRVSEKDRRAYNLYTTDKAISTRKAVRKLAFDWDNNVLSKGFSQQEKELVYDLLKRMAQNARSETDGK